MGMLTTCSRRATYQACRSVHVCLTSTTEVYLWAPLMCVTVLAAVLFCRCAGPVAGGDPIQRVSADLAH